MIRKTYGVKMAERPEIKPGQWVVLAPFNWFHIVGMCRLVDRQSGSRVYLAKDAEDKRTDYVQTSSVEYVCDTREEAEKVAAIRERVSREIRALRENGKGEIDELCGPQK
jgi:hypothetical protein